MIDPPHPIDPERLEKAAEALRPLEREVLILSSTERLRNDAIAARLDITTRTAERILARALRKLDRAIERQERPWWKIW